ncbi:MAG: YfaZ family protein [Pseudomonadales bacterium]|nr:YfaZ family protein [Pseudomonadales bacterium]
MRTRFFIVLLSGLLTFAGSSRADKIDINLKNEAFFIEYSYLPVKSNAIFSGSLLHHTDNGDLVSGRFRVEQTLYDVNSDFKAGIGARVLYIDATSDSGGALALSGTVRYAFPQNDKIWIAAVIDYAPQVVSFGDLDNFYSGEFSFGYQLIDHANIYIGARYTRTDFEDDNSFIFDRGAVFGISIDI